MSFSSYDLLYYKHEVLWANYEIREHYLKMSVRCIYENIGQVIRDYRYMCRILYSDSNLFGKLSLDQIISYELKLCTVQEYQLRTRGKPYMLEAGREMILFRMVQEILSFIRNQGSEASLQIKVIFGKTALGLIFDYTGIRVECSASVAGIPIATVDGYREDLFEKLGAKSRIGLVMFTIRNGIVRLN